MTITAFLLARIAEDEGDADRIVYDHGGMNFEPHSVRWLAECEAKRRIIGTAPYGHNGLHLCADEMTYDHECPVLLALASIYADHPDYREEWDTGAAD